MKTVYNDLSSLFVVMPPAIQQSYLEIGSKYNIEGDFDMLNDIAKLGDKSYYAPEKFAVKVV